MWTKVTKINLWLNLKTLYPEIGKILLMFSNVSSLKFMSYMTNVDWTEHSECITAAVQLLDSYLLRDSLVTSGSSGLVRRQPRRCMLANLCLRVSRSSCRLLFSVDWLALNLSISSSEMNSSSPSDDACSSSEQESCELVMLCSIVRYTCQHLKWLLTNHFKMCHKVQ